MQNEQKTDLPSISIKNRKINQGKQLKAPNETPMVFPSTMGGISFIMIKTPLFAPKKTSFSTIRGVFIKKEGVFIKKVRK